MYTEERVPEYFDATLPLDESVRMPSASWTVHTMRVTADGFQKLSHLEVSTHGLTHIDLPGAYCDSPCLKIYEELSLRERLALANQAAIGYQQPFCADCVIINLQDRFLRVDSLLCESMKRNRLQGRLPAYPVPLWTEEEYRGLIDALAVTADELQTTLSENSIGVKGAVVVFYTGWRAFTPLYLDCGHPYWWAWHPFLVHPYLTREAADWLALQGIRGVAIDAVSIDTPLRSWICLAQQGIPSPWPCMAELLNDIIARTSRTIDRCLPAHNVLLSADKLIIEMLDLTPEIVLFGNSPPFDIGGVELPQVVEAKVNVLPYSCSGLSDGLLAHVLLVRKKVG